MSEEPEDDFITPEQQRRATLYRILCRTYIRVQAKAEGRHPNTYGEAETATFIEEWEDAIRHDLAQICEVMEEARRAGIANASDTFRRIETADMDLVDQAIEIASEEAVRERAGESPREE